MSIFHSVSSKVSLLAFLFLLPVSASATVCWERGFGAYTEFSVGMFFLLALGVFVVLLSKKNWIECMFGLCLSLLMGMQFLHFSGIPIASFAVYDLVNYAMSLVWLVVYVFGALAVLALTIFVLWRKQQEQSRKEFLRWHLIGVLLLLVLCAPIFAIQYGTGTVCSFPPEGFLLLPQ